MMFTSRILQAVNDSTLDLTKDSRTADYIIVNSCTFDEYHENMSVSKIKEFALLSGKVVLIGCLASISPDYLKEYDIEIIPEINRLPDAIPEIDEFSITSPVIDTDIKNSFYNDLNAGQYNAELTRYNTGPALWIYRHAAGILSKNRANRRLVDAMTDDMNIKYDKNIADVEISRGCVFKCAYCIIRKARGSLISRPVNSIIEDIRKLSKKHSIIRLVSDECGSYGLDIGTNFITLMREIHKNFPGIKLNIFYLHPFYLETHYNSFKWIVDNMNINAINISVQSYSQHVLDAMNRPYAVESVTKGINYLRNNSPDTVIRTHIIVSYPAETVIDYLKTLFNINRTDIMTPFEYSPREGTDSYEQYKDFRILSSSMRFNMILYANRIAKLLKMTANIIKSNR